MAFTAETGSGDELANAYILEAFADTHHADHGNTAWAALMSADKQTSIVRASSYIDKRFGRKFRGVRKIKAQGLEWPRVDAFDNDGFTLFDVDDIPRQLKKACAEYALRAALIQTLAPDPVQSIPSQDLTTGAAARVTTVASGEVIRSKKVIGPIEKEEWFEAASKANSTVAAKRVQSGIISDVSIPEYPEADMWIEELLISANSIPLARA